MNRKWLAIAIMFISALALKAQDQTATTSKAPEQSTMTDKEKISYAAGAAVGRNYLQYKKDLELDLDIDVLIQGLKDAYTGAKVKVSEDEQKAAMEKFTKEMKEKQADKLAKSAVKNKADGEAFQLANKEKPEVYVIPNSGGVQFKVLTKGTGPKPAETDTVEVNFTLSLIDGKELKEVTNRSKPEQSVSWAVSQNIPGMKTVLLNMTEGSEWEVVIPAEQAYSDKGSGPIGPNSTLVFTIKLLKIQSKADSKAAAPAPASAP
jgi:FKBP-type peptidyl-prolyl cis-trans isomerase